MTEVLRPWYGRLLTVVIGVISASMVVFAGSQGEWRDAALVLPWAALVAGACWATFWRPRVEVSDAGVRLVNVTRTIDIPWPAVRAVETKWALTVVSTYGRHTAWSAPAPGARGAVRSLATPRDDPHGPGARGLVAPGDLADSPSGSVAAAVRERWTSLRAAGHLDDPRLEHERAPVRWHVGTFAVGLALLAIGIATAV
jgi:hypothetical protein